jgi:germination protein M
MLKKIVYILIFLFIAFFLILILRPKNVTLYFYCKDSEYLVPTSIKVKGFLNLPEFAIKELLKGPKKEGKLRPTFPKDVKLINLKIKNKTAFVNFNNKLKDYGGSATEIGIVGSVVLTLTEFKNIKKVQFLIEGKKIKYLPQGTEIYKPIERKEWEKYIIQISHEKFGNKK